MPPPTTTTTTTTTGKLPSQAAPARGRQTASKPLVTTSTASKAGASTKAAELRTSKSTSGTLRADARQQTNTKPVRTPVPKASASEQVNVTVPTEATPVPKTPTPAPTESTDAPTESANAPTEPTDPPKELATHLLSESTPNQSGAPPPQPPNASNPKFKSTPVPVQTSDPLQVAAQLYPWLYMTSTLDACFTSAEQTAKAYLETRLHRLAESESEFADQKTRFQAEQAMEFYEVLLTDGFARTAPRIMQAFLVHGDACESAEAEALRLAVDADKVLRLAEGDEEEEDDGDWDAPLRGYSKMLDTLEQLHAEALDLQASIVEFTSSLEPGGSSAGGVNGDVTIDDRPAGPSGAQAQILGVFRACLPVLRARVANLVMAQELVDGARENASISVRMESLGLLE